SVSPEIESRKWVLATISSLKDPGMIAFPTHRLLRIPRMTEGRVVQSIETRFDVERLQGFRAIEHELRMTVGPSLCIAFKSGTAYKATPVTHDKDDAMWQIDSFVFQEQMLKKVLFSIGTPDEIEIEYDHDVRSVESKMRKGKHDMSVLLRPPNLELVWTLAAAGQRLPKKTTYFWPKIWSGFLFYRML
ncbi:MAG: hypothetical protein LUQ27_05950, partial [Methanomassiliicoccales archaeon]|nr:hypothetical protein [Methanomassiliicoccales archaeon]